MILLGVTDGDDITSALTSAIAESTRAGGYAGTILIPEGTFYLSGSIIAPQVQGLRIIGASVEGTRIIWRGGSAVPMFDFNRCQDCLLADLKIEVDAGCTLRCGVRCYNSDAALTGTHVVAGQLSSRVYLERVFMEFQGRAQDGWQIVWDPISTVERGKNDHHRGTNVQIQGYTDSGVVIQGDQPQDCVFDHCIVQGRDTGLYGINGGRPTADGVYRCVGFFFRDGTIMENQIADIFYARNYGDILLVDGCHSEGSVRFFDMPNFDQDTSRIDATGATFRNVKHHCSSSPAAAGEAIRYYGNGPLIIEGCALGKLNEPTNLYRIRMQTRPEGIRGKFIFNSMVSMGDTAPIFTAQLPTNYDAGYRHKGSNVNGPLIDNVDNGRQKPVTEDDWIRVLGIVPRSWYRFGETAGPRDVESVNATDDTLDFTAHHWATGDGPVRLTTAGSAPGGLATGTDYWVIKATANAIALATSRPNALAGTRVEITSAGSGTHTIKDGSNGLIYDCNRRLPPLDVAPNNFPKYRQARPPFAEEWAEFTSATADQQFYLNDITDVNPRAMSVAFLIHHGEATLTVADEFLCVLGAGATGAGGGPSVRFTAAGLMRATIDGVTQNGTHDYRAAGDYLTIAGYDYTAGGVFTVHTNKEFIVVPTPSLTVGNSARKGLGTGSSLGTLKTAGYQVGLFAVFIGKDAEKLIAMGSEAHRRMG